MNLIEERQSVRRYTDQEVTDEVLKQILNAGRLAPSWMNCQPWHFIAVRNQETKNLLSELSCGQPQVRKAPVVIVCVADTGAWSKEVFGKVLKQKGMADTAIDNIMTMPALYPPVLGEDTVLLRSIEQVTIAMSYMTLEAENQGVGCCVIGALGNEVTKVLPEVSAKVKETLNLTDKHCIISMLTLGYSREPEPTNKLRKEFNEVVSLEKLGQTF